MYDQELLVEDGRVALNAFRAATATAAATTYEVRPERAGMIFVELKPLRR